MSPLPLTTRLFTLIALVFALSAAVLAQVTRFVEPGQMGTGSLLLQTPEPGRYVEAPRVATDFDVTVTGPIARTRVTQRFENPADGWVEGIYVFPLPEGSAVDTLKMVVGGRIIVADIKEKQEARIIYEEAKAKGQKAALLEQERPNLFSNSIANIGPHETIVVQMEYQETIRQSGGSYALRVPLVVAPRYTPSPEAAAATVSTEPSRKTTGIDPPVLDPRSNDPVNPVTLTVTLNAGFNVKDLASPYHGIAVADLAAGSKRVTLKDDTIPADRDFVLTWAPDVASEPAVALFSETIGNDNYLLAYVTPPEAPKTEKRMPREVIFVIDNSGSMGGPSMGQAKASLIYALGRLDPIDRFNVIRFDDTMDIVFPDAVAATPENVGTAKHFVGGLEATGGTEMIPPLRAALRDENRGDTSTVRQVIFLTDGAIGNEQDMFNILGSMLGRSRVFMVGIGSAPNSYLMNRAAELGRGSFTYIGSGEEVEDRMRELFGKLESPLVTALAARLEGAAELTPDPLPDLYRGEPLVMLAKTATAAGKLEISGTQDGKPWQAAVPVAGATAGSGIAKLWARRKIADAEVAASLNTITPEQADKRILAIALEHHLVSRVTSLVAVDKTPARTPGTPLTRAEVPLNLPHGWDFDKVFGEPAGTRHAEFDDKLLQLASAPRTANSPAEQLALPEGATFSELLLLLGLASLLLSLGLVLIAFRRQPN